jgi:ATP/maltotriose-dependent transcriptional regulator MalT
MGVTSSADLTPAPVAAHDWGAIYARLSAADRDRSLEAAELAQLATAAYLTGREDECYQASERAHLEYLRKGETTQAVRCAFWLAMPLILKGDMARGAGWIGRAQRLIDEQQLDCVERGYLLVPGGFRTIMEGDYAGAAALFDQAVKIGQRFGERDLVALARQCMGRVLIGLGDIAEGVALLDEVMVGVVAGEVSAIPAGMIYCSVVEACQELFDIRRAHEWTAALSTWCDGQPGLVPFRGQCLVHRSQVLQFRGSWAEAKAEAHKALERLSVPAGQPAMGLALYQIADLHRLLGELTSAERCYAQAAECGHPVQPGLALLRLAQGRVDAAEAAIRHAADEATDRVSRARVLGPLVEIELAAGNIPAARAASEELVKLSQDPASPHLRAVAASALGTTMLAEGNTAGALDELRLACATWAELGAPYEHARARVVVGQCRRQLGDTDTGRLDLTAARQAFHRLGATPDVARVDALLRRTAAADPKSRLSSREVEVLRLVAAGMTNSAIATELFISEKTVARHLSNIFTKLGVSSRAASTAYAYEHGLM